MVGVRALYKDFTDSDGNTIIEYNISIESEIKMADKSTKSISLDIIIDHTVSISNFIIKDYSGAGQATITIEIVTQTTTKPELIVPLTVKNSQNEKNDLSIFGFKFSLTDIILFGAIGVLIILACRVIFAISCTCRSRKDFRQKLVEAKF